jgi:hypothetical protein
MGDPIVRKTGHIGSDYFHDCHSNSNPTLGMQGSKALSKLHFSDSKKLIECFKRLFEEPEEERYKNQVLNDREKEAFVREARPFRLVVKNGWILAQSPLGIMKCPL